MIFPLFFWGGGVFLKKSNTLTTTPNPIPIPNPIDPPIPIPNPIDPLTLSLDLALPRQFFYYFFLRSPGFELQTSDFEVHLHLHYATQAIVANLLIFVALTNKLLVPDSPFPSDTY